MEYNKYIYVYLDSRKPGDYQYGNLKFRFEPFYVGKGQGNRKTQHLNEAYTNKDVNVHKCRIIRKIKEETGNDPIILEAEICLDEQGSLKLEIEYIKTIGRHNLKTGPLTNQTNGGQTSPAAGRTFEETYGIRRAAEIKQKISKSNTGKTRTDEEKQKMSEARKGDKSYMYGVPMSEEIKQKVSDTRIREGTAKGKNNPMYGKTHSEASKQKMSKTSKALMTECKRQQMITSNPNSKSIKCHNGNIFPSLSEAGKFYGFVGLTAPRRRIKNGVWNYVLPCFSR